MAGRQCIIRILVAALVMHCSLAPSAVEAQPALTAQNALSGCSYTWSAYATGWRTRTWQPWDCSNALPVTDAVFLGQAANGSGTSGQTSCTLTSGSHYNHPSFDGATPGTSRCMFVPPASSSIQPSPAMTVCSYTFTGYATGWRTRTWQAADCSHGLPAAGAWSIGQAENGNGTEGMPSCSTTQGGHYNHPTWNGATSGTVRCVFLASAPVTNPESTLCQYTWTDDATGWRTRTWTPSDCSHGLPPANAWAIGSSENGSGAGSMASCAAASGSHYNHPTQTGPTNGTVRCLYVRRPAPPPGSGYAFDLNLDGTRDTNLSFEACNDGTGRHCLVATSWLFSGSRKIALGGTDARPASTSPGTVNDQTAIRLIGDHTGDGLAEVAVPYVRALADSQYAPALGVIDVDTQSVLGNASSPAGMCTFDGGYLLRSDTLFPAGPDGRTYPAFTPGYGDTNNVAATRWGWGCLFRAGQSSADCGAGFLRIDTQPAAPQPYGTTVWFRESFGHLLDADGDGWEDLNLPFHWAFLTISGQTGAALTTTSYDVAAATGAQPPTFHSGRNYGTHRSVVVGSTKRTVLVAGSPVGDFDNPMCNVTRFTALLSQSGTPATRTLAWKRYDGFHSNNWDALPWVPPGGEAPTPSRWGDFADKCIHRYADSRTNVDGQEALLVNYFAVDWAHPGNAALAGRCKNEQYQLYMDPAWTQAKQDAWYTCAAQHAGALGRWGMKVLRESDGAGLTGSQDTYVWGWSNALKSGGEMLYLVELLPNPVRFNLEDDTGNRLAPPRLQVYALVGGLWSSRGMLPAAGRPVLVDMPRSGSLGTGDFYGVKALSLEDRDADGQMDVQLRSATGSTLWVGWSSASGTWVTKP